LRDNIPIISGSVDGTRHDTEEDVMSNPRDFQVVADIKKQYGHVIDLEKSPMSIIEIIQNYRYRVPVFFLVDEVAAPDGTGCGPHDRNPQDPGVVAALNLLVELRREVQALRAKIK
jgi:hypothetical protein